MKKVYKSIDEQIDILKEKGIIIKNEKLVKDILLKENYYHVISGYKSIFKVDGKYIDNVTFDEIYSLYNFDRELRSLILKYILKIENNIKSYISNVFSKNYGVSNYLVKENFVSSCKYTTQVNELLFKIKSAISSNIQNDNKMIVHYIKNHGYIPMWVLVRILTFGNMSKFYHLMKPEDKKQVASLIKIHYNDISLYLKILTIARNVCAHDEVLYNISFNTIISSKGVSDILNSLNVECVNNIYKKGVNDFFSIIVIFKKMLDSADFYLFYKSFCLLLDSLKSNIFSVKFSNILDTMGIPKDYLKL